MAEIISRLKLESGEFDNKIKRAAEGLLQMEQECRKVGGTLAILEKDQKQFVQGIGSMETVSKTARGRLGELTQAFTELRMQYNRLTTEEKQGDFGKALSSSLNQLKTRMQETKSELKSVEAEMSGGVGNKFGEFGNILDTLGSRLGVAGNLTELLTSRTALLTTAVGASVAVVGKAASAWADYNSELARQDQVTTVTTGLTGKDADSMTSAMRALSSTYGVDFREAVNAANTLMSQFGKTGDEAIQLLRDGMQGMIYGDGQKLLTMIQQYAPAFQSAGVSASQLVAVIHNTEGGIFTDQNMLSIVMGMSRLREMTKNTSEALAGIGVDSAKMSQQMQDGTLSVFEALKQVSKAIDDNKGKTMEVGTVMSTVFGRQGKMAGDNLGKAIATLNTNLEETKQQTGEVGESFARLQNANEDLEAAMRQTFGFNGWEEMSNAIESTLIRALTSVLNLINSVGGALKDLYNLIPSGGNPRQITAPYFTPPADSPLRNANLSPQSQQWLTRKTAYNDPESPYYSAWDHPQQQALPLPPQLLNRQQTTETVTVEADTSSALDSISKLEAEIQRIQKLHKDATTGSERAAYAAEIKQLQQQLAAMGGGSGSGGGGSATAVKAIKLEEMASATGGTTESMVELRQQLQHYRKALERATTQVEMIDAQRGIDQTQAQIAAQPMALRYGMDTEEYIQMQKEIVQQMKEALGPLENINFNPTGRTPKQETTKSDKTLDDGMSKLAGGINSLAGGLESLGVDLGKDFNRVIGGIQGVATILTSISAILSAIEAISAVGALIPFANGGIVPHAAFGRMIGGTSYSGDNVFAGNAWVNSGELVLNKAQQGVLASELQGGGMGDMQLEAVVSAEQLRFVLRNNSLRRGKGEYITSKFS